ncbi:MAG TPA: toll/interleukin-1 receptor domain-containing protein [Puia sp.]|jgi:hypothetical protein|nr:toll/interleukin-1 receptor domain-containing protein [Puia sp.]
MALNRYYYTQKVENKADHFSKNPKCCFISYQSSDKEQAKIVADYLLAGGIDVYFDQYDGDLRISSQIKNPKHVVESLCKGINNSSHMIVVLSPATMTSKWVPFEIGFGYDKTEVLTLCLKGILPGTLPEYIRTCKVLRDIYDLNVQISKFTNIEKKILEVRNQIKIYNSAEHPLTAIMDSLITDNYQ